jgi:hypothetical protein
MFEEYKLHCPGIKVYIITCHRRERGGVGSGFRALIIHNLGAKYGWEVNAYIRWLYPRDKAPGLL